MIAFILSLFARKAPAVSIDRVRDAALSSEDRKARRNWNNGYYN